jgi:2'-5' RNA ligase
MSSVPQQGEAAAVPFTAAVLIPPREAWPPIQAIRRAHDPHVARWMPHVTLLYPFVREFRFPSAAGGLAAACAQAPPFRLTLGQFGLFRHGERRATLWLRPDPVEAVKGLQAAMLARFPWCDDVCRFGGGFAPHLSVGSWPAAAARTALATLQETWKPLQWQVDAACLIARPEDGRGPFEVRHVLALGRSAPRAACDLPFYIHYPESSRGACT